MRSLYDDLLDWLDRFEPTTILVAGALIGMVIWQLIFSTVYYLQTGRWI